jgi:hypothetical protein
MMERDGGEDVSGRFGPCAGPLRRGKAHDRVLSGVERIVAQARVCAGLEKGVGEAYWKRAGYQLTVWSNWNSGAGSPASRSWPGV